MSMQIDREDGRGAESHVAGLELQEVQSTRQMGVSLKRLLFFIDLCMLSACAIALIYYHPILLMVAGALMVGWSCWGLAGLLSKRQSKTKG